MHRWRSRWRFAGQGTQVLLGGIRGLETEVLADLGPCGGVTAILDVNADEFQDFGLAGGQVFVHDVPPVTINIYSNRQMSRKGFEVFASPP
jgi:hypothetical protein